MRQINEADLQHALSDARSLPNLALRLRAVVRL